MAEETLILDIVTPTGPVAAATALAVPGVEVPGVMGELGILPRHVPFVSPVVTGVVRFRSGDGSVRVAVGRGFVEISEDGNVTVLADRAVAGDDVDASEVSTALAEVKTQLAAAKDADPAERLTLADEQDWLEAQLRAAAN